MSLKDKKLLLLITVLQLLMLFKKYLMISGRKQNKIWVDKGSEVTIGQ